jgi:ribosomal protein S18 acetylase RimI-like enzyme
MTDVTLRAATPADIRTLHRLMRDFAVSEGIEGRFFLTEASLHEALFGPRPLIEAVLAESDSTIVGFILWMVFFATIGGWNCMFVTNLFVAELYRRRGIGSALFRHLARIAVEKQYSVVQWDVNRSNARAIEFYRRIGAQPVINDLFMEELRGNALLALAGD